MRYPLYEVLPVLLRCTVFYHKKSKLCNSFHFFDKKKIFITKKATDDFSVALSLTYSFDFFKFFNFVFSSFILLL
jgi:hypothetical protein